MKIALQTLSILLGCSALLACDSSTDVDERLPAFSGEPVQFGALLCVNGEFSAKASGLERAAIFAEELVNGSANAFPDIPEDQIPCRLNGTCGTWAGRDAAGNSLRGRLKLLIADTEQRVERAIEAALSLVDEQQVPVIIGPCSSEEMFAVQSEVTKTRTLLISPSVTTNSISDIDDRTATDVGLGLPGYVYRNIVPDYIQVSVLSDFGSNTDPRNRTLIRGEDRSTTECTAEVDPNYCARTIGAGYTCVRSYDSAVADREFYVVSETACGGQPEGFCDTLGQNYECVDNVCQRYRERRYCTKDTRPTVAMVLYEDTPFGRDALSTIQERWVNSRGFNIVAATPFDPSARAGFADRINELFTSGAAELAARKSAGSVASTVNFGDTTIFLFAQATEGALLLQEWELQLPTLPAGSDTVFWLGTDTLRSEILLNQVGVRTARNLFTVDPYTTTADQGPVFEARYRARWGINPDQYTANTVDAILLAALANDRAGFVRERASSGPLGLNTAFEIKNSLQPVSVGCLTDINPQVLYPGCDNPGSITGVLWDRHESSVELLRQGREIKLLGVTGNLWLSPTGDVLNQVRVWKVASEGDELGFFPLALIEPAINGILLKEVE